MRIERVHIDSFGTIRDKTFRFGDGLTVIYGPNESGKTSLKSFITGTMFPDRLPRYPAPKAGDSGEIDMVLKDGSAVTIRRTGRKSDSPIPGICSLTGQEYTAIYSMSPEDLREMNLVMKGGIREKLLSVPGSSLLPETINDIVERKTSFLPETRRNSRCVISLDKDAVHNAQQTVDTIKARASGDSAFNSLCAEETRLIGELKTAEEEEEAAYNASLEKAKTEGLSDIRNQIDDLEKKRGFFAYAGRMNPEEYGKLKTMAEESEKNLESMKLKLGELEKDLPKNSGTIISLSGRLSAFRNHSATATPTKKPSYALTVGGAVITVVGIAVAALVDVTAGMAVTVVGVIAVVASFVRGRKKNTVNPLENEWKSLCRDFGIEPASVSDDILRMEGLITKAREVERTRGAVEEAASDADRKNRDLRTLLDNYGITGDPEKAVADKRELDGIDAQLKALRKNVSETEIPSQQPDTDPGFDTASRRTKDIRAELARIDERKKAILSDKDTDKAMNVLSEKKNILSEHIKEWTVLAIGKAILDKACAKSYEENKPSAYADADRYLGAMTSGRYGLVSEPGQTDIAIIEKSTGVRKTDDYWSTGTGDQVKLALKMGVARGLCPDSPPMILDDILLTSDGKRAEECAKAIADMSKSVQVIFFTCSSESKNALASAGAEVISLFS